MTTYKIIKVDWSYDKTTEPNWMTGDYDYIGEHYKVTLFNESNLLDIIEKRIEKRNFSEAEFYVGRKIEIQQENVTDNRKLKCYITEDDREVIIQDTNNGEILDYTGTGFCIEEIFETLKYVYQLAKDGVDIEFELPDMYERMHEEMKHGI